MPFPIIATIALFVVACVLAASAVAANELMRRVLRKVWLGLLLLVAINLALKIPWTGAFYHGLEYEDCFVHQAVAREFYYGHTGVQDRGSFLQGIWSIGSLRDGGQMYQTFFNPIGYASIIFLGQILFGDHAWVGHLLSIAASALGSAVVFLLASTMRRGLEFPIWTSVIFTSLPLVNANASMTSSEVFSSFFVALSLLMLRLAHLEESTPAARELAKIALSFVLAFAIACRRDNCIILILVPALVWMERKSESPRLSSLIIETLQLIILPASFALLCFGLLDNIQEEAPVDGSPAFSILYVHRLVPALATALLKPSFYLCFSAALLFVPFVWRRVSGLQQIALVLFAYFVAYGSHFRSHYFLEGAEVTAFDMVRYLLNLSPLIAIAATAGLLLIPWSFLNRSLSRARRRIACVTVALVTLLLSLTITVESRAKLVEEEQQVRIRGPRESLSHITSKDDRVWVFTTVPCLFQIYAPPHIGIVDLDVASTHASPLVDEILASGRAFLFLTPLDLAPENLRRYPERRRWLDSKHWHTVLSINGDSLHRFELE